MTKNPPQGYGAAISARMDFSDYDRIDEDALNRVLWHSIKGADVPYPAPVRRVLAIAIRLVDVPERRRLARWVARLSLKTCCRPILRRSDQATDDSLCLGG